MLVPEEDYGIEFFEEPDWDQAIVPEAALEGIFADGPDDEEFFICGLDDPADVHTGNGSSNNHTSSSSSNRPRQQHASRRARHPARATATANQ